MVAFGDSITDGEQARLEPAGEGLATGDTNGRYPDDLARRLLAAKIPLSVLDAGISGNELLRSGLPVVGPAGFRASDLDALAQAGVTDVIVLEGINDIAGDPAGEDERADRRLRTSDQRSPRGRRGGPLGTLTPSGGAPSAYGSPAAYAEREQVNQWIRTQRPGRHRQLDAAGATHDPPRTTGTPSVPTTSTSASPATGLAGAVDLGLLAQAGLRRSAPVALAPKHELLGQRDPRRRRRIGDD